MLDEEAREGTPESFFMNEEKSLARWRFELKSIGKKHWNVFYEHFLGESISNYKIFYRALKLYGDMNVFEAILAAARQSIEGDPLNYVMRVTHSLWKEEQLKLDKEQDEEKEAKVAILESKKRNQELAKKLNKVKRRKG